jgi:hypothetical protein
MSETKSRGRQTENTNAPHSLISANGTSHSSKNFRSHTRKSFPHDYHNHSQPAAVKETAVPACRFLNLSRSTILFC